MFIDYTATRELVGSGLDEIEVDPERTNRNSNTVARESVSMSGAVRESILDRIEYKWSVATVPVPLADLARWREFASSVANGELFTIDLDGTKAVPVNPISVSLVKNSFKENRFSHLYMSFSFDVLER